MDMPTVSRFRLVSCGFVLHGSAATPSRVNLQEGSWTSARRVKDSRSKDTWSRANATSTSTLDATSQIHAVKCKLLQEVAGTNRGALAKLSRHRSIEDIIDELENVAPSAGAPLHTVDGSWELIYTTAEVFRSSPFFWAVQEGLVQDTDLAAAVFKFTDSIPGAEVGRAVQRIDLAAGLLVSEVELSVFPGLKGTVTTTSSITGMVGDVMRVSVQSTQVTGSNLFPFLDQVEVPVREIFERIRGVGSTGVASRCTYLDDDLRVSRTVHDGEVFVYRRIQD